MEPRERILLESKALFKQRGVRSVTMDDIAGALGMSKKTLYTYFENKAEIVRAVAEEHFRREIASQEAALARGMDPVHTMLEVMLSAAKGLAEIPMHMVYDIRKHYPDAWCLFDEFKEEYILQVLRENLAQGVAEGYYRKDMDIELAALIRVAQIESSLNENYFPETKFSFVQVQMEHFKIYLHGIMTMKGKRLLYQYLNQPEDE